CPVGYFPDSNILVVFWYIFKLLKIKSIQLFCYHKNSFTHIIKAKVWLYFLLVKVKAFLPYLFGIIPPVIRLYIVVNAFCSHHFLYVGFLSFGFLKGRFP